MINETKELVKKEEDIHIIKCIKCDNTPLIHFTHSHPICISLQCEHCNISQNVPLSIYINKMQSKGNSKIENHYEYYCYDDKIQFVNEDINQHIGHCYITIKSVISLLNIANFKKNIENAENYLMNEYPSMKEKLLQLFSEKSDTINKLYEENRETNMKILSIMKSIKNSFNERDYYSVQNINNNLNISLNSLIGKEDFTSMLNNLKYNYIVNINKVNITNLQLIRDVPSHKKMLYALLILKDGRIASCSEDSSIIIYSVPSFEIQKVLRGHSSNVSYICQTETEKLVSASYDCTIRIWTVINNIYTCDVTLFGHKKDVRKVITLTKRRIASSSKDLSIIIWNSNPPYQPLKVLTGHTDWVDSVIQLKGREVLVSGSTGDDCSLRFWDLNTYLCIAIVKKVKCCYMDSILEIDNNRLIVGGNNLITIVNTITYQIETKYYNRTFGYTNSILRLRDGSLLIGKGNEVYREEVYQFDPFTLKILSTNTTYSQKNKGIRCSLALDSHTIVLGSYNGNLTVWQY